MALSIQCTISARYARATARLPRLRLGLPFLLAGLLVPAAPAAPEPLDQPGKDSRGPTETTRATQTSTEPAPDGLWPSPTLMRNLLHRHVENLAEKYDLSENQRQQLRKDFVDSWTQYLTQNRATLQPLVNEYLELRMDVAPPSPERVRDWANRALPVVDEMGQRIRQDNDRFRAGLNPVQRARFDLESMKFAAGLKLAQQKLARWNRGEFEPGELWEPLPHQKRQNKEKNFAAAEPAQATDAPAPQDPDRLATAAAELSDAGAPPDQIVLELGAWDRYIVEFINKYGLDQGQRDAVRSVLAEVRQRALAHREHHREEIDALERRIAAHKGDEAELDRIRSSLVELYGPIDALFRELKRRVDPIPTSDQKAAAHASSRPPGPVPPQQPAADPKRPAAP